MTNFGRALSWRRRWRRIPAHLAGCECRTAWRGHIRKLGKSRSASLVLTDRRMQRRQPIPGQRFEAALCSGALRPVAKVRRRIQNGRKADEPTAVHINPDHFLGTAAGRVTTPERNAEAWKQCYELLDATLQSSDVVTKVYVLIGPQGSGKSTWARRKNIEEPHSIFFDAILVKRSERSPILVRVRERGVPAVAVWFRTSLADCLARNSARPTDEIAAEQGIRNVYSAVEPPSHSEGFTEVIEVGHISD